MVQPGCTVQVWLNREFVAEASLRFERQGVKVKITRAHRIGLNESNGHLAAGLAGQGSLRRSAIRCHQFCGRVTWWRSCATGVQRVIRFIGFIRKTGT